MSDALLLARIGSLHENLARVDESLKRLRDWQTQLERAQPGDRVAGDLWHTIDFEVRRKFALERKRLEKLRNDVQAANGGGATSSTDLWTRYARVRDESEQLFDECLEFIGALAFRRTGLDEERMCQLADALILALAREGYAQSWAFLTVPSLRDVLSKSRLRLSRIRFPEWTLWTLPVTAYALGHEVMAGQDVAELVAHGMDTWARQDVAGRHVPVLIADVFASYLMGPAYGHAAIRLRLDPSRAYSEDAKRPAEASRAHVVLATLRRMDARGDGDWKRQVTALGEQWDGSLAAARPTGSPPDSPAALDELVDEAVTHFGEALNLTAQYDAGAWNLAKGLYQRWRDEAQRSDAAALSDEPAPDEQLLGARDVLNAAWLMRLDRPRDTTRIEQAATKMCRRILAVGEPAAGGPGQAAIPTG